jgi:cold shock protein
LAPVGIWTSEDCDVPVGRVRFYDAEKGFGFLTKDDGGDVYVRASALPDGVSSLKPGQKVEFGVVEGRRGEQALSLRLIDPPPSLAKAHRKPPEQMTVIVEDLIKMLDGVGNTYRRGKHPDSRTGTKVASVLRAVADELEL